MPPAILFDDACTTLSPLTDLRASFDVRTGALTTLERLTRVLDLQIIGLHVPDDLAALTRERHKLPVNEDGGSHPDVLAINGRCVLPFPAIKDLRPGQCLAEDGALIAARLPGALAAKAIRRDLSGLVHAGPIPYPSLLSRPWQIRTFRNAAIRADLELLHREDLESPPQGVTRIGSYPVVIAPTAKLYPTSVLDAEHGAIVVAEHATIRPGAVVCGPAYIGPHALVNDRALVKGNTAIGPWAKVGGEIGGTIIQGYSNKAHDGHLGDSWLGEWVNLGAGTVNSNLLNTYGEVAAHRAPGAPREKTGQQFLGCILGDHAKTAIGTRIMTGAVVGTGTMWAASRPIVGAVAPFTWATDIETRTARLEKFLSIVRAMMARRDAEPSPAYLERLRAVHAAAAKGPAADAV